MRESKVDRKPWARPTLRRMTSGSAENNAGSGTDGSGGVS